jgi:hypothetical protein
MVENEKKKLKDWYPKLWVFNWKSDEKSRVIN